MARRKKLYSVLQNIVFYSQAFGAYPYNELIQIEERHILCIGYQALLLISNNIIAVGVSRMEYEGKFRAAIFSFMIFCTRCVISALPTINFATVLIKRHLMKEIFETLIQVDSRLEQLGFRLGYNLKRSVTYFNCLLVIVATICFVLAVDNSLTSYFDIFHLAVGLCSTSATIQLITDLVSLAGQQFRLINSFLSESSCNQSRINLFIELHNKVSLACYMLNKVFTRQLLVISFTVFFHTTITIHWLVDQHLSFYSLCTDTILMMRIAFTLSHLILGYALVNTCVWTGIQSKDFTEILHMMMLEDKTDQICNNMVAAATTYLFVLMQLGQQID